MRLRWLLIGFLLLFSLGVTAQKKIVYRADWAYHDDESFPGIEKLVGNVVFKHDNTIGYCDSAYNYPRENYLIAFGSPVRIHINDSVTLYGDQVVYEGNTKLSNISGNVILKDNQSALYTNILKYDSELDVGYYPVWGKMITQKDTLTSDQGYYYTKTKMVFLYGDVTLVNDSYTMKCDSLSYHTEDKIVYFISRTELVSEKNRIITHSGWYDTHNDQANLIDSVEFYNENQILTGDTLFYDKNIEFGIGKGDVTMADTSQGYIVKGEYVEYSESGGLSWVTDRAILILISDGDSLYVHGDTLRMIIDTLQNPIEMHAFNKVKFFGVDLQGACDSMAYIVPDSILTMYYNPVIWSGENQLTADTIRFTILDSIHTRLDLLKSGFILTALFENTEFNQIKGATVVGYITEKQLERVDVINNAEAIYYILDEDTALIGINVSFTSEMVLIFEDNKIAQILFYNAPDGKIYADKELPWDDRFLKDFRFLDFYRPKSIEDIFKDPMPREKETKGLPTDSK